MPYYCYVHEGLYEAGDVDGCHNPACVSFREKDVPPVGPIMGVVPGGANDTKSYRFHMDFDKGLDKYKEARDNGLQPEGTTVEKVNKAEAQVQSHERALKKLGGAGEGLKVAPGVET